MITAPDLAVKALKIPTGGFPCPEDTHCALTGVTIGKGDKVENLPKLSSGFMDARKLLIVTGKTPYVLPSTIPFFKKSILGQTQKVLITKEAVYGLSKWDPRAWFILHPPEPPFAVLCSPATTQHQIWRVPLTLDADYWSIQMGGRTILMRRLIVLRAWEICKRLNDLHTTTKKKAMVSPFLGMVIGDDLSAGKLNPKAVAFAEEVGMGAEIRLLENLPSGDLWGLSALLYRGAGATLPDPLVLKNQPESTDETPE